MVIDSALDFLVLYQLLNGYVFVDKQTGKTKHDWVPRLMTKEM